MAQKALVLFILCLLFKMVQNDCRLQSVKMKGITLEGDIIIGGLFPVHSSNVYPMINFRDTPASVQCEVFRLRSYRWALGMIFAVEEINKNSELLPNISLGYWIYDSCYALSRVLLGTTWMLTGKEFPVPNYACRSNVPTAAIIGDSSSSMTIPMARILSLYHFPQISYGASVPILSDKIQFPSFLRTIPSDNFQSVILAQLVVCFGWTWVGILASDNDYGQTGSQILHAELVRNGICLAFLETIPALYSKVKIQHILEVIQTSSATAIIIFSIESVLLPLMEEISMHDIQGKVWIGSEAWSTSPSLSRKDLLTTLTGSIGLAIPRGDMPGFKEFIYNINPSILTRDIYVNLFWETAFACRWNSSKLYQNPKQNEIDSNVKLCTGKEKLEDLNIPFFDVFNVRYTFNVYKAMYVAAQALSDILSCKDQNKEFANKSCNHISDMKQWQLFHYMKNVNVLNQEVYYDENGNPPAKYDIINWQLGSDGAVSYVMVGNFHYLENDGWRLLINISSIIWNGNSTKVPVSVCREHCHVGFRKSTRQGQPSCCFDCIACSPGEIANQTDSTECLKCPEDQWPSDTKERCVIKTTEFLSYEDSLGRTLAAVSIALSLIPLIILVIFVRHSRKPLVRASNRQLSCLLLCTLMMCILCSLIFIGRPRKVTCAVQQSTFGVIFALCLSCVLAKTIMVLIAFSATDPQSCLHSWTGYRVPYFVIIVGVKVQVTICGLWVAMSPPFVALNTKVLKEKIVIECVDGSTVGFWCMMGYIGFLAFVCFVLAFIARKLPDAFNEAKYITFSIVVFLSVWVSFIPAYFSTKGKYMVALEIFAILASSVGMLGCIFFPKCYIIFLRPDLNTKSNIRGR
ncbi:vomeronasal type-2 receptor 1-like [Protopterus annectens]|uniref:vomeronasal type-2 receptor 1-like n=1 Tax=Protopterus annectens TaxID=7888 RepID=UPI001CFB613A|nr:vomeronasal type-2 receptor 1-like [Protopterus annectens]